MPSKYRIILEMASQTARDIASNADRYTDFLITAANNYKYSFISARANNSAFNSDSSYCLLASLEVLDDEGNFLRKADMFSKRTIKQKVTVQSVDTASEAYALSLAEKARIDMPYMSQLTGKTEQELFEDLKGVIFLNPMHISEEDGKPKYLPADEYLSGNVREKLRWAKQSAELYPEDYGENVRALEAVQPVDLTASEISVRLGATWLPPEIIEEFMFELFSTPRYCQWNIHVHYAQYTGEWNVEGKSYDRSNVKTHNTYGTGRVNGYTIVIDKAQTAIAETTTKIKVEHQAKKTAENQARRLELEATLKDLQGTCAPMMLNALCESPVALTKPNIQRMRELFPIPVEQRIIWADAEFDLRPSGIVCTGTGVFIKTNVGVWEKKSKKDTSEQNKSILFYYRWEDFDPAWFISDDPKENRVLMVEKQCTEHFIEGCRTLATQAAEQELELSAAAFSMSDRELETLLAKTVPTGVAALQTAQTAVFVEQKARINTPAGHGEMAEEAITLADRFLGLDATVVGRDNAKDGADRVVNEIFIQTKYYNSARGSLEACFRPEDGMYRYMKDGQPMQLEVPKDQYERVLQGFERKIEQGKVPGVTDPKEARKIVRKGRLTYNQAVNLTKPGTIESLAYDAMTGAVLCSCAFGITFVATVFLTWRKTGDIKQAVKAGMSAGIQVFGVSFVQHMVISQIARTGLANALLAPSQYVVGKLGYQTSATIVNGIRALSGKGAIYGAAASKHLAKILRSNVITSALTFAVFSIPETYNLASKKISTAQYTKNMTVLLGSIAGGAGGAIVAGIAAAKIAGAAGTAVAPGVGTAVGIAGGFVGGVVGAKATDVVGDILREDDVEILGRLFNAVVSCMTGEYLLDAEEMDKLMDSLDQIPQKEFKDIFSNIMKSERQENTIRDFLRPHFEKITAERESFTLPSGEIILEALMEECTE